MAIHLWDLQSTTVVSTEIKKYQKKSIKTTELNKKKMQNKKFLNKWQNKNHKQ